MAHYIYISLYMILYRHYIHVSHFFRFCEMFRPLYTCIVFHFARLHCVCFCPEPALVNVGSHKKLAPCKPCSYRFLVAAAVAVVVQLRLPAYEVRLRSGETGVRFKFLMRNDEFFRRAYVNISRKSAVQIPVCLSLRAGQWLPCTRSGNLGGA